MLIYMKKHGNPKMATSSQPGAIPTIVKMLRVSYYFVPFEDEMGGVCSTYERIKNFLTKNWREQTTWKT
jgi:hypothetical protein